MTVQVAVARLAALFLTFVSIPALAGICRVTPSGVAANSGGDWSVPKDLQSALSASAICNEIWVAKGVYKPTLYKNADSMLVSFNIAPGVAVYGGFSGVETQRAQRNVAANTTILSGDIDNNDANAAGSQIDVTFNDIVGNNSYHVVFLNGATVGGPILSDTVLDGFTITGGQAEGSTSPNDLGGAIYCYGYGTGHTCSPTLNDMIFIGNRALAGGGAIYNNGSYGESSPTLTNVIFTGNDAGYGSGGAIYNNASAGTSSPLLSRADFRNNTVYSGGAMYNFGGSGTSSPTIGDVTFDSNSAFGIGGAIFSYGSNGGASSPALNRVTFSGNTAGTGGAMANSAYYAATYPTLDNVTFVNNTTTSNGGAILNHAYGSGFGCNPILRNVTFSGNSAQSGGAIYSDGYNGTCNLILSNTILWGDTADGLPSEIVSNLAVPAIFDSIVQGGCPQTGFGSCTNVIDADPMLGPLQNNGGYTNTLLPGTGSAAIDKGTCVNAEDQRGISRPQGAGCDIGAVEVTDDRIFASAFEDASA